MSSYCKCQANVHSRRIALDRRIQKSINTGKCNNLIKLLPDFALRHSEYCAIQENVFSPGQLTMKSSSDFKKTSNSSSEFNPTLCRFRNATKNFQERTFTGTVSSDNTDDFSFFDVKAYVSKRPEFLNLISLNDFSPPKQIHRLASKIIYFARQRLTQGDIAFAPLRSMPDEISFRQV